VNRESQKNRIKIKIRIKNKIMGDNINKWMAMGMGRETHLSVPSREGRLE
jgi:hypothetical protein